MLFLFSVGICGPLSPIVVLFPEVSMLSYHHCTGRRIFTTFPFFVIIAVLLLCAFMFFVFFFFFLYKVQGSFFFFWLLQTRVLHRPLLLLFTTTCVLLFVLVFCHIQLYLHQRLLFFFLTYDLFIFFWF